MDNDIMELDYLRYLEASIEEQTSLENFVNKCIGINESTSINEQLQVFTEGVVDTMRTNWQKFKVWVKQVWARFLEKLANTFSNPQGYLEQYKDIILNKKVKDNYEVTIPDHSVGVKRILGGETIPRIQANTIFNFCKGVTTSYSETGDNGQGLQLKLFMNCLRRLMLILVIIVKLNQHLNSIFLAEKLLG